VGKKRGENEMNKRLLSWWILRHVYKLPDDRETGLWTAVLRILPDGMEWEDIKSTDFGEILRLKYEDAKAKNTYVNHKMAQYCVMLVAVIGVLEYRAARGDIDAYPENRTLFDYADEILKKMYGKGRINKADYETLYDDVKQLRKDLLRE
jgi:hypothetical protein